MHELLISVNVVASVVLLISALVFDLATYSYIDKAIMVLRNFANTNFCTHVYIKAKCSEQGFAKVV